MSLRNETITAVGGKIAQAETSTMFKRRFLMRMIFVLSGGTFLDGYILRIVGPVSARVRPCAGGTGRRANGA